MSGASRLPRIVVVAWLASACVTNEPVEPGDRSVLVTAGRLAEFGLVVPGGYERFESIQRQRVVGALMLEYELHDEEAQRVPYVYSLAEVHPSARDACLSFSAGNLGVSLSRLEVRETQGFFEYGERSRFGRIENGDGAPVGNIFNMCHSRTAFLVAFVGIYFDDAEQWAAFIHPHLRALEALEAQERR